MARAGLPLGLLLAAVATAQEPVPAPVFEVAVDVVAVDVSVVDPQGRPVLGLAPEDFTVHVDGRPRQVVSAQYVGRGLAPPAPRPPQAAHYTTNAGASVGRLVLLLVDRGNIGRVGVRRVQDAADRFLSTLAPADRVGLAIIPGPSPGVEFTADHDQVRQALEKVVGLADRSGSQVPVARAVAWLERGDRTRWEQWLDSQCGNSPDEQQAEMCRKLLEAEATQVYNAYQERSRSSLGGLRAVFEGLRGIEGSKTVVLVSEGLGGEMRAEVKELARVASEAQVILFMLLLDVPGLEMAVDRSVSSSREDRELETGSIYDLASLARGTVLKVSGSADQPFQRIARELMGYYLIGFAPDPGDRDGKSHSVAVRVAREQTTVRARGVLTIPVQAPNAQQLVAAALRSPFVEPGLVLKVATYTRPAAGGKVKLLLAAEVERASRPVSVGYVLLAADGKVVASRLVQGLDEGDAAHVAFASEASVDPGSYTLRLAAVDAAGRRGSVHHQTQAVVVSAGGLRVSDLVLAPLSEEGPAPPAVDLALDAAGLVALLELASPDAETLAGATVTLELAESADGKALIEIPLEASPASPDGIRVARATVGAGLLPPGDYVARASVSVGGKPLAEMMRPFRIAAPRAGAPAVRIPFAGLLTEARPYERSDLLKPEVLAHFLDRMTQIVPGPPPEGVAAAIEDARQGRPDVMLGRLSDATKEDVRVAFLRGVSYYALGNLNASLTQLQAALRTRSDFFPAVVYMGGCYAAGGKDQDAIGAWQTALIGETGSPAVYAVLGDALLRTKEAGEAAGILDEGIAAFPGDQGLQRRLALAHAMAGHEQQALALLTAWVDAHPEDTPALYATLALLFDGFSREAAGGAKAEQLQRLRRYGKAYLDLNGPNRQIVERWLRYLDSHAGG